MSEGKLLYKTKTNCLYDDGNNMVCITGGSGYDDSDDDYIYGTRQDVIGIVAGIITAPETDPETINRYTDIISVLV